MKTMEQSLSEVDYSHYLCFSVSQRFNNLIPQYNINRYTEEQFENYQLIKSLVLISLIGISRSVGPIPNLGTAFNKDFRYGC